VIFLVQPSLIYSWCPSSSNFVREQGAGRKKRSVLAAHERFFDEQRSYQAKGPFMDGIVDLLLSINYL
jgi:hypothetical protein